MYWYEIVINDAIRRRVNLEMQLFGRTRDTGQLGRPPARWRRTA